MLFFKWRKQGREVSAYEVRNGKAKVDFRLVASGTGLVCRVNRYSLSSLLLRTVLGI